MFCTQCGNKINEGKNFCAHCGNSLSKKRNTSSQKKTQQKSVQNKSMIYSIFYLLAVIFLLVFLLFLALFLIDLLITDPTAGMFNIGAVLFTALSTYLFFRSRKKTKNKVEQARNQFFKDMFTASLWGTAGFIITAISYWNTSEGGSYTAMYGLAFIGVWNMVSGYKRYQEIKPLLDQSSKEEDIYFDNFQEILHAYFHKSKNDFLKFLINLGFSQQSAQSFYDSLSNHYGNTSSKSHTGEMSFQAAFELLGIPKTKNVSDIRHAYRKMAKMYHPDIKGSGNADKFIQLNSAYEKALSFAKHG